MGATPHSSKKKRVTLGMIRHPRYSGFPLHPHLRFAFHMHTRNLRWVAEDSMSLTLEPHPTKYYEFPSRAPSRETPRIHSCISVSLRTQRPNQTAKKKLTRSRCMIMRHFAVTHDMPETDTRKYIGNPERAPQKSKLGDKKTKVCEHKTRGCTHSVSKIEPLRQQRRASPVK
jgi:hypothetical protein